MKRLFCVSMLALAMGCGEGAPADMTPEKEAEMKAEMDQNMKDMMGQMNANTPPGTAKPQANP